MTPFVLLVVAGFVARLGYSMARSPVLPRFAQDLGASPELIGLIVAASTITGVVGKLPAGALSDLLGRRRMMLLGSLFFAGPPFLYPLVDGPGALLGLRFAHGAATAIFSPVASALVADLSQRARAQRLGWFAAGGDLGSALGPLAGGLILFATASYATTYLAVAALGLLPLAFVLRLPDDAPTPGAGPGLAGRSRQFWAGIREVATSRPVLVVSGLEAVLYVGYGALVGFFPLYGRSIGLDDARIAVVMGAQLFTTMAAKPLTGALSDRLGRRPLVVAGLGLCAAALPLVPRLTGLPALMAVSAAFGLGAAIVTPSTTALVADLVRAARMGSAMGVFGTIWDAGEALGPIVAGLLVARLSYAAAFDIIGAGMALAALGFLVTVREPRAA